MRLVLEFPQELTKRKIGDLFPPQAFHSFKVQVFKEQNIELPTQTLSQVSNGGLFSDWRFSYGYGQRSLRSMVVCS